MSAIERVIAFHIARLKDKNPEVRIRSIEELALLEATGVLGILEEVYHTDPDEKVRQAAKKAGRALFFKMSANERRSDGRSAPG